MIRCARWLVVTVCVTSLVVAAAEATDSYIDEPGKKVPVLYDVDVVVAGGGIAGTVASITAARYGARTVVIDRFGRVGGNMGPGMFAGGALHLALQDNEALVNRIGLGGIPAEFIERIIYSRFNADQIPAEERQALKQSNFNLPRHRVGGGGLGYATESQTVSYVAFQMMKEAGVETLLSAYVADPIMDGNTVKGVFVETKSGRVAVKGKIVIDATGEADVAFRAGAPVQIKAGPNAGLTYGIKDVDWMKFYEYLGENGVKKQKWYDGNSFPKERDGFRYQKKVGDCTINIRCYGWEQIVMDRTGTRGTVDMSDAKQVSLMEREHRIHLYDFAKFMRKHAPGFEKAHIVIVSEYLGARGGRSAVPVQPVTGADVLANRKFDDVIYIYFHDKSPHQCDIPYRILLPRKINGLLLAGRSGLVYGPNFRQRHSVMLHAQAAGIAAAMCAADDIEPRHLDAKKLQRALVEAGCPLGDEERIAELGLN